MVEAWKPIVVEKKGVTYDYTGLYEISRDGEVRRVKTGRVLKKDLANGRYYHIKLSKDGKVKTFAIHQLVAIAFIPNPNGYDTVDHINHNRLDNRVENLRWLPFSENASDGARRRNARYSVNVFIS